jgi:hypothetical protein
MSQMNMIQEKKSLYLPLHTTVRSQHSAICKLFFLAKQFNVNFGDKLFL